ncbi:MAG: hypothetical protein LBT48_01345 [Prevotellaceae bacterium]|jgi:hypothetical protein|nr:hypothetical protein [Prevotellaceae bacterium]
MKVKNFILCALSLMAGLALTVACKDDTVIEVEDPTLEVAPTTYDVTSADGGSTTITVTSNKSWKATAGAAWITISGETEKSFVLDVSANTSTEARTDTVTVIAETLTKKITVSQVGKEAGTKVLSVTPGTANVAAEGAAAAFLVTTDAGSWTATSSATWTTISPASGTDNGTITVTAIANTGAERSATITVAAGTLTKTATLTQAEYVAPPQNYTILEEDGVFKESAAYRASNLMYWGANAPVLAYEITTTAAGTLTVDPGVDRLVIFFGENTTGAGAYNPARNTVGTVACESGKTYHLILTLQSDGPNFATTSSEFTVKLEYSVKDGATATPNGIAVPPITNVLLTESGNYTDGAKPACGSDAGTYPVLGYKVTLTTAGFLNVIDKVSPDYNIWFLVYSNPNDFGSYGKAIASGDGTVTSSEELTAGTYYVMGILNHWYGDIPDDGSGITYDVEVAISSAGSAEAYECVPPADGTLQDFSKATADAAAAGTTWTLEDTRDGKRYKALKLPNNAGVWLYTDFKYTQGLTLDVDYKLRPENGEAVADYAYYRYDVAVAVAPTGWSLATFEEWQAARNCGVNLAHNDNPDELYRSFLWAILDDNGGGRFNADGSFNEEPWGGNEPYAPWTSTVCGGDIMSTASFGCGDAFGPIGCTDGWGQLDKNGFAYARYFIHTDPPASADVSTEADFNAALSAGAATINLKSDITLDAALVLTYTVTINGEGHKLSPTSTPGYSAISLPSGGNFSMTINRLHIDGFTNEWGGGVNIRNNGDLTFNSCIFTNNSAGGGGGGAICKVWSSGNGLMTVNGCTFIGNSQGEGHGSAIFYHDGTIIGAGNVFYNNTGNSFAVSGGGGGRMSYSAYNIGLVGSGVDDDGTNVLISADPFNGSFVPTTNDIKILPAGLPAGYPTVDFAGNAIVGGGFAGARQQ